MSAVTVSPKKTSISLFITPLDVEVDGAIVTILEVAKLQLPWEEYQASCQVKYKDVISRVFQVSYKDSNELKQKLKTEVAKFKYAYFLLGREELKRRGIAI